MLGEAFSGLLVSINRVITKLTIENNLTNTIIFFTLSIIGEIVSIQYQDCHTTSVASFETFNY